MKLRSHLVTLVLATAVPLVVFALVLVVLYANAARDSIQRGTMTTTAALAVALDRELAGTVDALEALATSPYLDAGDLRGFYEHARRALEANQDRWRTIVLADPSGQQHLNLLAPFGGRLPEATAKPWITEAAATRSPVVSNLFVGSLERRAVVSVLVPVLREGAAKYVLLAQFDPQTLWRRLRQESLPPDWIGGIVDRSNVLIAQTREAERLAGQRATAVTVQEIGKGTEGWFRGPMLDGGIRYGAFRRAEVSGWTVLLRVPTATVDGPVRRSVGLVVGVGLALAALAVVVAAILARRIVSPIESMLRVAGDLGRGVIGSRPSGSGVAEVRELGDALHEAGRLLGEREASLHGEIAQRKRHEEALAESETRFRITVASIGDAVIATDDHGRVTLMNRVAEALTGWTQEEAIGRPVEEVFVILSEESRQPAENPAARVLREGKITGLANHTVLVSRTGRELPIDDSAAPIRGEDGRVVGVVMVFRDVTERRRADATFRLVVEAAPNAIVVVSPEGRILLVNSQTEQLFGYGRDELIGRPVETLVPLRFRANHPESRQDFFAAPKSRPMGAGRDLLGLRKDGTEFPVEIGLNPVETDQGLLVLSAIVDITERRQAERDRAVLLERERAARAEAERVARAIQALQPVGEPSLGEASVDGVVRESLGHVRAALAGDTATLLLLADDSAHLVHVASDGLQEELAEEVRIPLGQGVAGRIAVSDAGMIFADLAEAEVVSPFLRDHVKSLIGAPLRVGNRLIGVVHVGASAPRRFTEEDLKLLRLVAERMALIIERARLYEAERAARREAEAANRAKDEFLATLSHELREPINAIVGWLQVVRSGKRDEVTLARAFEVIERNAKLQAQLVDDLLDVSRIITGRLHLDIQPVDLVAVIGAAIDVVRPAADAKGVRLETALDPSAGLVSGDPGRLQQVVWNLLSNAIRFTPKGGRVEVRLQRVASRAELAVSDTGNGISRAFLPHVFERFRQADRASAGAHGGLGLGLAIVRHLVELHGGTVHAASAGEGQGATFTVKLPLPAVQARVTKREGVPLAAGRGLPPPEAPLGLGGARVLVVDDEASARDLLRTVLEGCGAVVTAAGSATEAIEALARERPDVLISDIAMPGEDGYALIRRVRALPPERGGRIPAVAVTAHARAEDRARALVAGFQLHVPKPVEAAELVAVITSLLGRTAGQGTPGAGAEG